MFNITKTRIDNSHSCREPSAHLLHGLALLRTKRHALVRRAGTTPTNPSLIANAVNDLLHIHASRCSAF